MPTVLLLNGPNFNLLGCRESELSCKSILKDLEGQVSSRLSERKIKCSAYQSDSEEELIEWLHKRRDADFLLLNPGDLAHTSVGLRDSVLATEIPFLEIHLSNVHQIEEFRFRSYFSDFAIGSLVGLGVKGYLLATQFAADYLEQKTISASFK